MTRWTAVVACALLVPACASAPSQPRPVDPVGIFDFSTQVEGTDVTGTIQIRSVNGGYTGVVTSSATDDIPIRSVTVEGQKVTVLADTPEGPLTMVLTFTNNDEFTGTWTFTTLSGTATGRRRTAG